MKLAGMWAGHIHSKSSISLGAPASSLSRTRILPHQRRHGQDGRSGSVRQGLGKAVRLGLWVLPSSTQVPVLPLDPHCLVSLLRRLGRGPYWLRPFPGSCLHSCAHSSSVTLNPTGSLLHFLSALSPDPCSWIVLRILQVSAERSETSLIHLCPSPAGFLSVRRGRLHKVLIKLDFSHCACALWAGRGGAGGGAGHVPVSPSKFQVPGHNSTLGNISNPLGR